MRILEIISKYIIIPGALLYFSGWIYLYTFCRQIGIDVSVLNLDTNSIILNSYYVLRFMVRTIEDIAAAYWIVLLATAILAAILIVLSRPGWPLGRVVERFFYPFDRALRRNSTSTIVELATLVVLLMGLGAVAREAAADYLQQIPRRPGARMVFTFTQQFIADSMAQCPKTAPDQCYYHYLELANDGSRLRMLLETTDYFVMWAQPVEPKDQQTGQVFILKKDGIQYTSVDIDPCHIGGQSSCAEPD